MKAKIISVSILMLAAWASAHPGHTTPSYGIFWKNGYAGAARGQVGVAPKDIWRYAFVSRYQWNGSGCALWQP